jgi:hypothetical protein
MLLLLNNFIAIDWVETLNGLITVIQKKTKNCSQNGFGNKIPEWHMRDICSDVNNKCTYV